MSQKYKKIDPETFSQESFEMKPYFKQLNVSFSRLQMKIDSKMCPTIAENFHQDPKYRSINYLCVGCSVRKVSQPLSESTSDHVREQTSEPLNSSLDSIGHIVRCRAYSDLRLNLDLNVQTDFLSYFKSVIDRRQAEEDQIHIN